MSGQLRLARRQDSLFTRALDADAMLAIFRRELPSLSHVPVRVTSCSMWAHSASRLRCRTLRAVYQVTVESRSGRKWNNLLVGTVPASGDFLGPEVMARCRAAREHSAAQPFRELSLYLPELQMAVIFFPVDPGLPALAEITGADGGRLLAPYFGPRPASPPTVTDWALRRYRPSSGCALRVNVELGNGNGSPRRQAVDVKIFADDRGSAHFHNLHVDP